MQQLYMVECTNWLMYERFIGLIPPANSDGGNMITSAYQNPSPHDYYQQRPAYSQNNDFTQQPNSVPSGILPPNNNDTMNKGLIRSSIPTNNSGINSYQLPFNQGTRSS